MQASAPLSSLHAGGTSIGRQVMSAAAQHLTPVTMELGGKNPVYVDETVDVQVS